MKYTFTITVDDVEFCGGNQTPAEEKRRVRKMEKELAGLVCRHLLGFKTSKGINCEAKPK